MFGSEWRKSVEVRLANLEAKEASRKDGKVRAVSQDDGSVILLSPERDAALMERDAQHWAARDGQAPAIDEA